MRRIFSILLCTCFLGLAACVPQATYDDLMNAYRAQEQQLLQSQADLEGARANAQALREQLAMAMAEIERLGGDKNAINARLEELMKQYEEMYDLAGRSIGPLPSSVAAALKALADAHPDMLTWDEARGMLRFNSDFTFDLGSVAIKQEGREIIRALAGIMNSPAASELEAHVIGHTDNVPVTNPATVRDHKNNVTLSAHRAISVRDALVSSGVSGNRFMVAGFGEYRPVVANPSSGGAAQNRRVEVFFRPMPPDGVLPASSERSQPTTARPVTRPAPPVEPMK